MCSTFNPFIYYQKAKKEYQFKTFYPQVWSASLQKNETSGTSRDTEKSNQNGSVGRCWSHVLNVLEAKERKKYI